MGLKRATVSRKAEKFEAVSHYRDEIIAVRLGQSEKGIALLQSWGRVHGPT